MTTIMIIAWNVMGLNFPNKRRDVKWVLRKYCCDAAILVESKLEEINRNIALSFWGGRPFDWIFPPLVGRSGGIIVIWDTQALEYVGFFYLF